MLVQDLIERFRTRKWASAILAAVVTFGYGVVSKGINYLDQTRDIDKAALFAASVLVSFLALGRVRSKFRAPWPLIALTTTMFVSLLFSPLPIVERVNFTNHSNGSFVANLLIFLAIWALLQVSTIRELHFGMVVAGLMVLVLVAAQIYTDPATAFFPKLRVDESISFALRGPFEGGNVLAITLAPCLIAALTYKTSGHIKNILIWLLVSLEVSTIFCSNSVTVSITIFLVVLLFVLITLLRAGRKIIAGLVVLSLSLLASWLLYTSSLPSFLTQNTTLSGRTAIWWSTLRLALDNFWTGIGWQTKLFKNNANWDVLTSQGEIYFRHAHNDLLHWFLVTGIFGIIFLVASLAAVLILSIGSLTKKVDERSALWFLLTTIYLLVTGLTEVVTVYPYQWFVLCLVVGGAYKVKSGNNLSGTLL